MRGRKNFVTLLTTVGYPTWYLIILLFVFAAPAIIEGKIIYVDDDANGLNDGTSWQNAYNYLQDALTDANSSDKPVEIRVAQGIYRPDETSAEPNGASNREATFQLINGVTIKGGYAGFGEPDPNARDVELYETILSGDLDGNDFDVIDPCDLQNEPTRGENSYNVFHHPWGSNLDATAILDGFTITGGNANDNSQPHDYGGGMHNYYSSPTLVNCTFIRNSATKWGGGMYNGHSSPILTNCTFSRNSANYDGGGMDNYYSSPTLTNCTFNGNSAYYFGGGMDNRHDSSPDVKNCKFIGNLAFDGGGICNWESSPNLKRCRFNGNSANGYGGGMYNGFSSLTMTNCILIANSANYGGGMYICYHSSPTLTNCTIADNNAPNGPAVVCNSFQQQYPSTVKIVNCIIWNTYPWLLNNDGSTINITYSDVQGGWLGEGNINEDPNFTDPNNSDYHLKSQAGRWDPNSASWVKDDVTSPCIDAGDPASPIGYEPFPNGGVIDMGAYGGTVEASKSYFGEPVCETIVAGDINGDCIVNFKDFAFMALHWLEEY